MEDGRVQIASSHHGYNTICQAKKLSSICYTVSDRGDDNWSRVRSSRGERPPEAGSSFDDWGGTRWTCLNFALITLNFHTGTPCD